MVETFVQSTDDVVKFLKDQHNLIKDMFDEVLSASDPKARETAFVELRQLLAVHETAEEMVVHPRVRHEAANGDEIVDARLKEEHKAKEMLSALEGMDIDSPKFIAELTVFRDAVIDTPSTRSPRSSPSSSATSRLTTAGGWPRLSWPRRPSRRLARMPAWRAPRRTLVGPFASMLDRARDPSSAAVRSQPAPLEQNRPSRRLCGRF